MTDSRPNATSLLLLPILCVLPILAQSPEQEVARLLEEERRYTLVPEKLFNLLGWPLPDNGGSANWYEFFVDPLMFLQSAGSFRLLAHPKNIRVHSRSFAAKSVDTSGR